MIPSQSPLQQWRLQHQPKLPDVLQDVSMLVAHPNGNKERVETGNVELSKFFPKTMNLAALAFVTGTRVHATPKRVGVVLSGGQAPGGHNVISGLYDALKSMHPDSRLFGFCNGSQGLLTNKSVEITAALLSAYRNQGGFDLLGSGRGKIETLQQFQAAEATAHSLNLDGIVVVGGDDSNTNAALLAEFFLARCCKTCIAGVPKTIDGDLKSEHIEISFGFDTASKTYSEIIGNIERDALSAKKCYYFIKLMGRSASHITLECALQTHPNVALISEEVEAEGKTLLEITQSLCDVICERSKLGREYGVILIPEGIIEFIPECKVLIEELNHLLATEQSIGKPLHVSKIESLLFAEEKSAYVMQHLSKAAAQCFRIIPLAIQMQLLEDRDPHGNVQVSKIETERLFIGTVKQELANRRAAGSYAGKFNAQPHFCGYEGRSCMPSNFDAHYCYALGHVAALLVDAGLTGYICCVHNLSRPVEEWQIGGRPLTSMMTVEQRHGKPKPVIRKALVDLNGMPFEVFKRKRLEWSLQDDYCYPGPLQFFGPPELTEAITHTLALEHMHTHAHSSLKAKVH